MCVELIHPVARAVAGRFLTAATTITCKRKRLTNQKENNKKKAYSIQTFSYLIAGKSRFKPWCSYPITQLFSRLIPIFRCHAYVCLRLCLVFQGIRSEDRTVAEGFAPTAEMFYGTRVEVR